MAPHREARPPFHLHVCVQTGSTARNPWPPHRLLYVFLSLSGRKQPMGTRRYLLQLTTSLGRRPVGARTPPLTSALPRSCDGLSEAPREVRWKTEPESEGCSWFSGVQERDALCLWINQSTSFSQHLRHKTGRGRERFPNHDLANHAIPYV